MKIFIEGMGDIWMRNRSGKEVAIVMSNNIETLRSQDVLSKHVY